MGTYIVAVDDAYAAALRALGHEVIVGADAEAVIELKEKLANDLVHFVNTNVIGKPATPLTKAEFLAGVEALTEQSELVALGFDVATDVVWPDADAALEAGVAAIEKDYKEAMKPQAFWADFSSLPPHPDAIFDDFKALKPAAASAAKAVAKMGESVKAASESFQAVIPGVMAKLKYLQLLGGMGGAGSYLLGFDDGKVVVRDVSRQVVIHLGLGSFDVLPNGEVFQMKVGPVVLTYKYDAGADVLLGVGWQDHGWEHPMEPLTVKFGDWDVPLPLLEDKLAVCLSVIQAQGDGFWVSWEDVAEAMASAMAFVKNTSFGIGGMPALGSPWGDVVFLLCQVRLYQKFDAGSGVHALAIAALDVEIDKLAQVATAQQITKMYVELPSLAMCATCGVPKPKWNEVGCFEGCKHHEVMWHNVWPAAWSPVPVARGRQVLRMQLELDERTWKAWDD